MNPDGSSGRLDAFAMPNTFLYTNNAQCASLEASIPSTHTKQVSEHVACSGYEEIKHKETPTLHLFFSQRLSLPVARSYGAFIERPTKVESDDFG